MSELVQYWQGSYGEAIGLALLHFVWVGALLGAIAAVCLRVLRGSDPRLRYGVACGFLVLMAGAPAVLVYLLWPAEFAPGLPPSSLSNSAAHSFGGIGTAGWTWYGIVLWCWAAGVAVFALRAVGGWTWVAWRLSRRTAVSSEVESALRDIAGQLGITRRVRAFVCSRVTGPVVFGVWRPVVLLPLSFATGMPAEQWQAILAHEMAHVARHDFLVNCLQAVAEALLFYHPAVWWLSRRIRQERELCCDAAAAAWCGDRIVYARALLALEETRQTWAMAAAGGDLKSRIERLLAPPAAGASATTVIVTLVCGGLLAGVLGVSLLRAQEPKTDEETARRIAYARDRFNGEHTARGRLYVLYGPPDEIESHPSQNREEWRYRDGRDITFNGEQYMMAGPMTSANGTKPEEVLPIGRIDFSALPEPLRSTLPVQLSGFTRQPYSEELRQQIETAARQIDPRLVFLWQFDQVSKRNKLRMWLRGDTVLDPAFAPQEGRVTITEEGMRARLKEAPLPVYPPLAAQARIAGTVYLSVLVGRDGHVSAIRMMSGHPLLQQAAMEAVRQRVYEPTVVNGVTVEVATTVSIRMGPTQ